jgi:hypothetical protein
LNEKSLSNLDLFFPASLSKLFVSKSLHGVGHMRNVCWGGGNRIQERFLLETAGVTEANVGKVIALQPRLIGCSMSNKLQPLVEYFLNHQLRQDQLGTMVADFPMLLKYNVSIIKPKLEYFKRVLALPFDDLIAFPR